MEDGDRPLAEKLVAACRSEDVSWLILAVGENHVAEMKRLALDLCNHDPSPSGDGRFISSGHAYWGVGPTISWHRACQDPSYLVGHRSVDSFGARWRAICPTGEGDLPTTYVSLGPGTGEKDVAIVRSLGRFEGKQAYVPVDMSGEMLRLLSEMHPGDNVVLQDMAPIQVDFSVRSNVQTLRALLNHLVGADTPILFSLLGNTLANFENDQEMLAMLTDCLLAHEDDRLLLELATSTVIDESAAKRAELEYRGAPLFLKWVTSALMTHTDLAIDPDGVKFLPSVDPDRALVLKVVYANVSNEPTDVTLVDGSPFRFHPKDTIRLDLTRKYHPDAVSKLLAAASLTVQERQPTSLSKPFGLELLLARRDPNASSSLRAADFRVF